MVDRIDKLRPALHSASGGLRCRQPQSLPVLFHTPANKPGTPIPGQNIHSMSARGSRRRRKHSTG